MLGPRSNSDVIDRAVKSAYLNPLTLPEEFEGTPAQINESIRKAIETSKQKISELNDTLAKLADTHKQELQKLLWDVHVSRLIADAIARFGQLRHTYVVVGWVPSAKLETLTQRLKQASKEILIEATSHRTCGTSSKCSGCLAKSRLLSPFELLVNTYARPRYEEIDPTVLDRGHFSSALRSNVWRCGSWARAGCHWLACSQQGCPSIASLAAWEACWSLAVKRQ